MSNCFLFLKKKRTDHCSRLFVKSYLLHHHRFLAAVREGEHNPSVIVNGDALNGVSRKTADRLGKYQTYLPCKSIGYHFVEAVTLFGVRSRDAFIGINLLENPVLRLCPICGQAFVCKGKGSRRKYCGSPECNKRRVAQNVQDHRKKKKSPHYRRRAWRPNKENRHRTRKNTLSVPILF